MKEGVHVPSRMSAYFIGLVLALLAPSAGTGSTSIALSDGERAWLTSHSAIVVGEYRSSHGSLDGDWSAGMARDYLREAANLLGAELRVQVYDDRNALLEAACLDDIDLVMNVPMTVEQTRCLSLSRPYLSVPSVVVGRIDNQGILLETGLSHARIAVESDSQILDSLRERYPKAMFTSVAAPSDAMRKVISGDADAYVGSLYPVAAFLDANPKSPIGIVRKNNLPTTTLHFAVPNVDAALASALDKAIEAVPETRRKEIQDRWLVSPTAWSAHGTFQLRAGERAWLAELPELRLGFLSAASPVSFKGQDGQPSGIIEDYLRPLEAVGVRFDPAPDPTWSGVQDLIRRDAIDAYIGPISGVAAAYPTWVVSKPFARIPYVIVMPMGSESVLGTKDLDGMRVLAVGDVPQIRASLAAEAPTARLIDATSARGALAALDAGEADAYIANLAVVDPLIRENYPGRLRIAAPTNLHDSLGLAASPRHSMLITLFDRIVEATSDSEHQRIRDRWLATNYQHGLSLATVLKWVLPVLLALLAVVIVYAASYWRLRREVRRRGVVERRLSEVTQSMPAVVYRAERRPDGSLHFPYIAGDMPSLFGISAEEAMDSPDRFFDRVHEDDIPRLDEAAEQADNAPEVLELDFRARSTEGWRWIHSRSRLHRSNDGTLGWSGYWIDVTDSYAQAEELAKAKDASERAAAAKAEFLATMSHEIRTPMSGILGMLERLGHTSLSANQRRVLNTVEDSAEVLRQIIDDTLDFSKMEAGALSLERAPIDPRVLADNTLLMVAGQAHAKGLLLRSAVGADVAAQLSGDPVRLRQILFNLLSNAVKFTDAGTVSLRIEVAEEGGAEQRIAFSVADTGIGISEEQRDRLFEPFMQADASTHRSHGGTGLGLSICSRLVGLMGGTINLESEAGVGTVAKVVIELPVLRRKPEPVDRSGVTIKLHDLELADALDNWLDGLAIADTAQSIRFVDKIDEVEPDSALRRVLVTDEPVDFANAEATSNSVLSSNPFLGCEIARVCGTTERGESLAPPAGIQAGDEPAPRARILVAEDHPTNQDLIRWRLSQLGYECVIVEDGRDALRAMLTQRFDALLTDCQMPNMDGYDLAASIRNSANPSICRIPIIALTARVLDDELARCRDVGMNEILTKPVKLEKLREVLARLIGKGQSGPEPVSSSPIVDLDALAENFASRDVAKRMLASVVTSSRDDLRMLDRALQAADTKDALRVLHRMAGALRVVGAESLAQEALALLDAISLGGLTTAAAGASAMFSRNVTAYIKAAADQC